eukprot:Gb_17393 [translate_table: standard]
MYMDFDIEGYEINENSAWPLAPIWPGVYAWELLGVAGNAWNGEPGCSIAIGSDFIWGKFIFLATGRPGDCMEMLLECLRNPGCRLGIVTGFQLAVLPIVVQSEDQRIQLGFGWPYMTVDRVYIEDHAVGHEKMKNKLL